MIRILIADDHPVVRSGYRRLFESTGKYQVVAEASSGDEAVTLFKEFRPDIVVMDAMMPGIGISSSIQRIIKHQGNAYILVVSLYDHLSLVERCFIAGASGYVTKSSSGVVLMQALSEAVKRKRFISPDIAGVIALNQFNSQKVSSVSALTPKEFDVFLRITRGESLDEISNKMHLSKKTVSNYLSKIKKRLDVTSTAELVHLALQEKLLDF
jgi:two-component system, NarL family, invasion response regulator UvrY